MPVLRAILAHLSGPSPSRLLQVSVLHTAFIAQLDVVGVSPHWQLYAAQHLPDGPPGFQGQRTQLLQELLLLHAPAFAEDSSARAFLVDTLGVPAAWLAAALATWSRYSWQPEGVHLILSVQIFSSISSVHLTMSHTLHIALSLLAEKMQTWSQLQGTLATCRRLCGKSTASSRPQPRQHCGHRACCRKGSVAAVCRERPDVHSEALVATSAGLGVTLMALYCYNVSHVIKV